MCVQEAAITALQVSRTLEAASCSVTSTVKGQQADSTDGEPLPPVVPVSASEALLVCAERVCSPGVAGSVGRSTAVGLLHDVATMVKHGRSVVVLALTDLQGLFAASQQVRKHSHETLLHVSKPTDGTANILRGKRKQHTARKQVKGVLRKLHFLLSWANELAPSVYQSMLECVLLELQQHIASQTELQSSEQFNLNLDKFVQSALTNRPVLPSKSPVTAKV